MTGPSAAAAHWIRAVGLSAAFLRSTADRIPRWVLISAPVVIFIHYAVGDENAAVWPLRLGVDCAIIFEKSRQIAEAGLYSADAQLGNYGDFFAYPPPAVLIFSWWSQLGLTTFMLVWLALMGLGLFATVRAGAAGEPARIRKDLPLIGLLALLLADTPIGWDLRCANTNLIYLGIVMLGYMNLEQRPWLAGICIGVSTALKLYSGLLLVWLVVARPKAAAAALATSLVLWGLWPLVEFGWPGVLKIYSSWWRGLEMVSDPLTNPLVTHALNAPVTSLRATSQKLLGPDASPSFLDSIVYGSHLAWSLALLWYAWRSVRCGVATVPSRPVFADWIVLLLAPLPFSPLLEPYHAVPLLPAGLLLLVVALDPQAPRRQVGIAGAAIACLVIEQIAIRPLDVRGLRDSLQFLTVVVALGLLRPSLAEGAPRGPLDGHMPQREPEPGGRASGSPGLRGRALG